MTDPLAEPPCMRLLYGAIRTLEALPDPDLRWFQIGSTWPTYARRYLDAYDTHDDAKPRYAPTPHEVRVYLDVLVWARDLSRLQWKVMVLRADDYSLPLIADYLGMPLLAVQLEHQAAVALVAARANVAKVDTESGNVQFPRRHQCA